MILDLKPKMQSKEELQRIYESLKEGDFIELEPNPVEFKEGNLTWWIHSFGSLKAVQTKLRYTVSGIIGIEVGGITGGFYYWRFKKITKLSS